MGYKIEIVLVSIAVFLCGCIMLCVALNGNEGEPIVVEKYMDSDATNIISYEDDDTEKAEISQTSEKTKAERSEVTDAVVSNKVNINTATKEELMSLQGIGDVLSDRIIEYRKSAKFNSIDDIQRVKGIGEKTFENLKDSITV